MDKQPARPHLVWVCPASLAAILNSAPTLEMTRGLRQLGWQVDLLDGGPAGHQVVHGVEVTGISRPDVYLLRQIVFHFKVIFYLLARWQQIDIILFHQQSAVFLFPLRLARLFARTATPLLVMDTRTVPMEARGQATLKDRLRGSYFLLMNRFANHLADGQTAITFRMAAAVHIPPRQLWGVWPSGVRCEEFAGAIHRRRWPDTDDPLQLYYVGVLHYERNLMALARAVWWANQEGIRCTLHLVGEGTERQALEEFARKSGGSIEVLPPVPHEQIPALLSRAHVGVLAFPDLWNFRVSSPIKLFEYMAAGLPVLATRITCHTDVIGDGEYVFWAEDASVDGLLSALRQVDQARDGLADMGARAAAASQQYSWQASARSLSDALEYGLLLKTGRRAEEGLKVGKAL